MTQINIDEFIKLKENLKDKKIVFCSGSFDLIHAGHILFFEDCKKYGDILIVGVGCDKIIKTFKGDKRPILNEKIRIKIIDSLKPVDYCFLDTFSSKENPLESIKLILGILKPDFYIINEDAFNIPYREEICRELKIKMIILKRTCPEEFDNISTSKIIEKIKLL
jgi:D-glycero-beta-D-manno-heptose 1-phosphate adenylyltransferase